MAIWLSRLAYALGSQRHELADCQDHLLSPVADLVGGGFQHHHVCAADETSLDLAHAAVKTALADQAIDPDLLVYSTALPANATVDHGDAFARTRDVKQVMDFPASRLQADLGWERSAVFGVVQQACTSLIGSWRLAGALLDTEPGWTEAACVSADRFPPGALYEQSYNPISDAATFARVAREPEPGAFKVRAIHQITNGALSLADDSETVGSFFPWMHRTVTETLAKAGVDRVDWIVPQNTLTVAWTVLSRLLDLADVPVHDPTREQVGHMIAGDNVANLIDLADSGRLSEGDTILMTAAGYGANWQCAVLEVGPR